MGVRPVEQGQIEENHQQIKSKKRTYLDLNDPQVTRTVEGIRKSMTAAEFAQEFMCEPVAAGALFSGVYQAVKEPPSDYERVLSVLISGLHRITLC